MIPLSTLNTTHNDEPRKKGTPFYEKLNAAMEKLAEYNLFVHGTEVGEIRRKPVLHGIPTAKLQRILDFDDTKAKLQVLKRMRPKLAARFKRRELTQRE
jgi:hypothetical protein